MTRLLLDTSAYSAFKRGHRGMVDRLSEAASAMEHGLELLTTDDHYLRIPQILVDHQAP